MVIEFETEYSLYCKQVTDAFIAMNLDGVNKSEWSKQTSVFYLVEWEKKNGLIYSVNLDVSRALSGFTFEEAKKYNLKVSIEYLNENSLNYNEWLLKFKPN